MYRITKPSSPVVIEVDSDHELRQILPLLGIHTQPLQPLPDIVEQPSPIIQPEPEPAPAGICENCIRLTQAVPRNMVEQVFGIMRELLIEAKGVIKDGTDRQAGIAMIDRIIEIASTPLDPVKEREFIDDAAMKHRDARWKSGKRLDWDSLAKTRGYDTPDEMFSSMQEKGLTMQQMAKEIGVHYTTVWYKLRGRSKNA